MVVHEYVAVLNEYKERHPPPSTPSSRVPTAKTEN